MTTYASFCTAADCRTCTDPCLGHMVAEPPMAGMPWDDDDPEGPQGSSREPDDVFENEDGFLERRACATCYWRGSFYNCPGAEECRI